MGLLEAAAGKHLADWHVEEILQAASCEHSAGPDYQAYPSA